MRERRGTDFAGGKDGCFIATVWYMKEISGTTSVTEEGRST
jgi:hypothetical protein